jgi:mono/diheme cytochrome c family protein
MFYRALLCVTALLFVCSTGLAILAQDPKEEPKPDEEAGDGITRKDVPEDYAAKVAPDLKDPKLLEAGKKEYAADCAKCHGDAGAGDGKSGAKLEPRPTNLTSADFHDAVTDQYIFWRIKTGAESYGGEGKSKMKAASKSAKDEEIWELVAFVRSLKVEKVEILTRDQFKGVMADIKSANGKLIKAAKAREAENAAAEAETIEKLARKLLGSDHTHADGKKVRDQDDYKKFVEDFRKAAEEYAKLAKAGDWKAADEKQAGIGDGCGNCHDVYKKKW